MADPRDDARDKVDFRLQAFLPYQVRVYCTAVSMAVKPVYTARHGLSLGEWRAMAVLHDGEPSSAKEIVTRSSMDKVNVSRAIAGLQKKKLLERHIDPTDRRRVLLRLTRRGRKVLADLLPRVVEVERRLLAGLSAEEAETLYGLMRRVTANAAEIAPADPETMI